MRTRRRESGVQGCGGRRRKRSVDGSSVVGRRLAVLLGLTAGVAACAGGDGPDGTTVPASGSFGFGRAATAEEIHAIDIDVMPDGTGLPAGSGTVEGGAEVYAAKCAWCHGATGTEGPFDRLVGRLPGDEFPFARDPRVQLTIGNFWPYATTLYDYINRAMPFDAPGSLAPDEVYGLVAYLLYLNEIVPEDAVMDARTLPVVEMPSRDRFVPDVREGGPTVQ